MLVERMILWRYAEADGVLAVDGAGRRMIPTLLFVGLVAGVFVRGWRSLAGGSLVVVIAALLWGVGVGMTAESVNTFFGGAALALANLLFGGALSASMAHVYRLLIGKPHAATR